MDTKYIDLFGSFTDTNDTIYVYVRVSTDLQSTDGQLFEVYNYCKKESLYPPIKNIYVDNGVSGFKISYKDRKIGEILNKCKKGDTIIIPEISRIARNMYEVSEVLKHCCDSKILIIDIKNNVRYDGSMQSQLMGQLYGIVSLIERTQISERVKAGMKRAKNDGKKIGRQKGQIVRNKLDGKDDEIKQLIDQDMTMRAISRKLNVNVSQIRNYLIKHELFDKYKKL